MTTAQERLDALLGACNELSVACTVDFRSLETLGRIVVFTDHDDWNEFLVVVQRISAEVGAETVAEQERRISED